MTAESKTFAFKLARTAKDNAPKPWRARAGVTAAGCTLSDPITEDYREATDYNGNPRGNDAGYFC